MPDTTAAADAQPTGDDNGVPASPPTEGDGELGLFTVETPDDAAPDAGAPPAEPEPDPKAKLSEAMEHIATRDRELLVERKRLQDLETRLAGLEKVKDDPDAVLRAFGHDPVDYVYKGLQRDEPAAETAEQKIERLEAELNKDRQDRSEQQRQSVLNQRYAEQQQQYLQAIEAGADKNPYLARMVKQSGGQQLVHQMMQTAASEYSQTGQLIDPSAIIAATEKSTRETIRKNAEALAELDDFRSIFGTAPAPHATAPKPAPAPQQTLSRQMGGETAAPATRPMTEEELDQQFVDLIRKDGWVE